MQKTKTLWQNNSFDLSSAIGIFKLSAGQGDLPGLCTKHRSCHQPRTSSLPSSLEQSNSQNPPTLWTFLAVNAIKREWERAWGRTETQVSQFIIPLYSPVLPEEISIKLTEVIVKESMNKFFARLIHTYCDSLFKMPWLLCIMFT